jgi:hypothetical protein
LVLENAIDGTLDGSTDGFVARFNTSAGLVFSSYLGGAGYDAALGVAVSPTSVYVSGTTDSTDFPRAAGSCGAPSCATAAFVTRLSPEIGSVLSTGLLDGSGSDAAYSVRATANDVAYLAGSTYSQDFPTTPGAPQPQYGGGAFGGVPDTVSDAFFAVVPMRDGASDEAAFATYLGGSDHDFAWRVALDRTGGGAWVAGSTASPNFPIVNDGQNAGGDSFVAHYASGVPPAPPGGEEVVLHARDFRIAGQGVWTFGEPDPTAADGVLLFNPNGGVPKLAAAAANPAGYVEATFTAEAGRPYHLWMRMKAEDDYWTNDSIFVQFSDTVNGGTPVWRIGTTSATVVSLEDCSGCGEHAWGWNDNGYARVGDAIVFAESGVHTIRIQQREDGISFDQVILSSATWSVNAPGAAKDDATIVPRR